MITPLASQGDFCASAFEVFFGGETGKVVVEQ